MATGNNFPPRKAGITGADDFEPINVGENRYSEFQSNLASCFGYRTVEAIKADQLEKKLPVFSGRPPEKQEGVHRVVRGAGQLFRKLSKAKTVYPELLMDKAQFASKVIEPATRFEEGVHVSEEVLAADLLPGKKVYTLPERHPVFHSNSPSYEDIRQNDKRGTCYLLSGLASYARSPIGQKLLTDNIRDLGDGYAAVTLFDTVLDKDVTVIVSTARLTDAKGNDLYSFRNDNGVCWPALVEKAFHALKLSQVEVLKPLIETSKANGDSDYEDFLQTKLQEVYSQKQKSGNSLLDHNTLFNAVNCFPRLPVLDTESQGYKQHFNRPLVFSGVDLEDKTNIDQLRFNVERGVPVILGTRGDFKGKMLAAFSGTPTNHAVAVLSPATCQEAKRPNGVLVYDTYGSALDGKEVVVKLPSASASFTDEEAASYQADSMTDDLDGFDVVHRSEVPEKVTTQSAGRSVRFYSYEELHEYFSSAVVAPGGFRRVSASQ